MTPRGARRPTSREEAVRRVLSCILAVPPAPPGAPPDGGHRPIAYRLKETADGQALNGGKDPFAPHPADWSYGLRTPTADCVAVVLWASGIDRDQPGYKGSRDEWLNCASLIDDAYGAQVWCTHVSYFAAEPGDWLVTPDHIGMIIRPARVVPNSDPLVTFDHLVVDCSPRHGRETAVNTGGPWSERCQVLRYLHYTS